MSGTISSGSFGAASQLYALRGGGRSGSSNGAPDLSKLQEKLFSKMDGDGDGTVSETEYTTATKDAPKLPGGVSVPSYSDVDTENDGKVTLDEFKVASKKLESDLQAQFESLRASGMLSASSTSNAVSGSVSPALSSDSNSRVEEMFANFDSDGNGALSADEFATATKNAPSLPGGVQIPTYASLDTTQDGSVTLDEFKVGDEAVQRAIQAATGSRGPGGPGGPGGPDRSAASSSSSLQALLDSLSSSSDSTSSSSSSSSLAQLLADLGNSSSTSSSTSPNKASGNLATLLKQMEQKAYEKGNADGGGNTLPSSRVDTGLALRQLLDTFGGGQERSINSVKVTA